MAHNRGPDLNLPRWTSKFTLSAQKPSGDQEQQERGAGPGGSDASGASGLLSPKSLLHRTPGLGQARRVPLGDAANHNVQHAAGGANDKAAQQAATPARSGGAKASGAAEEPGTVTPLACLFERFDALAIGSAAGSAAPATGAGAAAPASVAIGSAAAAPRAPKSPLGPARRVPGAPGRGGAPQPPPPPRGREPAAGARVSFGTPVVHQYAGGPGGGDAPQGGAGAAETPLWSNAGHTPYSLTGSGPGGARARGALGISPLGGPDFDAALDEEGEEEEVDEEEVDEWEQEAEAEKEQVPQGRRGAEQAGGAEAGAGHGLDGEGAGGFKFASAAAAGGGGGGGAGGGGVGTPVLGARQTAGGDVTPMLFGAGAAGCGAGRGAMEAVPFALPAPTPKASLRKPARVPCELPKPHGAAELRALLHEQHAPHDPAGAGAGGSGAQPALGSISCLTPVRASRRVQGSLGLDINQVLTPVRRSARKAAPALAQRGRGGDAAMLEATHFCYEGNPILTPALEEDGQEGDERA